MGAGQPQRTTVDKCGSRPSYCVTGQARGTEDQLGLTGNSSWNSRRKKDWMISRISELAGRSYMFTNTGDGMQGQNSIKVEYGQCCTQQQERTCKIC